MKAKDAMTPNPDVVTPDEPLSRAARIMRDRDVGFVPVVQDRASMRMTGVITDRDIAIRHVADEHNVPCTVQHHMTASGIASVDPNADLDEVLGIMEREQLRRIPVIEQGRIVGVIAQADVAMKLDKPKEVADTVRKISEPGRKR